MSHPVLLIMLVTPHCMRRHDGGMLSSQRYYLSMVQMLVAVLQEALGMSFLCVVFCCCCCQSIEAEGCLLIKYYQMTSDQLFLFNILLVKELVLKVFSFFFSQFFNFNFLLKATS